MFLPSLFKIHFIYYHLVFVISIKCCTCIYLLLVRFFCPLKLCHVLLQCDPHAPPDEYLTRWVNVKEFRGFGFYAYTFMRCWCWYMCLIHDIDGYHILLFTHKSLSTILNSPIPASGSLIIVPYTCLYEEVQELMICFFL